MIPDDQSVFDCPLAELDPELYELIGGELGRQRTTLDLVASESVPPRAVLEAQGSILTAKYADGYPGDRAYDTCEWIDEIERLAIERAKSLFCADHANVQPYSGASSNMAVLHGLCEPGDPILGWDFEHGGHETHYWQGTSAGRFYRSAAYGVRRQDRLVDMEQVAEMAESLRPKVIFAGWSCYSRWIDFRRFREICDDVGAYLVVDMAHFSGLVAAGLHPDPVPYADACTMTVHKTLGGARGGAILCRAELADRIDAAVYPGEQGCPLPHVIAGKAVTFAIAATDGFRDRMERTGGRCSCHRRRSHLGRGAHFCACRHGRHRRPPISCRPRPVRARFEHRPGSAERSRRLSQCRAARVRRGGEARRVRAALRRESFGGPGLRADGIRSRRRNPRRRPGGPVGRPSAVI